MSLIKNIMFLDYFAPKVALWLLASADGLAVWSLGWPGHTHKPVLGGGAGGGEGDIPGWEG